MQRFSRLFPLALFGLALTAAVAFAGERGAHHRGGRGHALRNLERCLSSAGLSAEQQTAVQSILTDARTTLQADAEALKTAREQLRADLSSGADKSVIGQDTLNQEAAMTKLKSGVQAARDQVLAQLTPEQQSSFNSCSEQRRGRGEAPPNPQQ